MQLPVYNESQVQPNTLPTPNFQTGDPVAQAGMRVGQQLEHSSNQMFELARAEAVKANSAVVMGRIARLNTSRINLLYDPKAGLLTTQGEKALNISQVGATKFNEEYNKALEGLTPEQEQLFRQHTANDKKEVLLALNRHEAKQGKVLQVTNAKAVVDSHEQILGTLYTDIDGAFQTRLKQMQAAVLDMAQMQGFGAESPTAKSMITEVTSKAYQYAIEQLADTGDPSKAQEVLNKYSSQIAPGTMVLLQQKLKSNFKDARITKAYTELYEKFNGDFTAMNEELSKPGTQKTLGLNVEESFYVKKQISDAQVDKDKSDNIRWNKNATNVFLNLSKTSVGQIDMMVQRGDLSYQLGEHFKTEKKQVLTGGPSDPWAWYRAYTKIKDAAGDPDSMVKVRNEVFSMGGLSFADKKDLVKLTEGQEDKYEAGISKKGMDYIKSVVMPSQTMITAAKPAEAQKFLEAGIAYEKALSDARKKGEKITPEFIEKTSKSIAQTYSMTIYDQMDAVTAAQRAAKAKREGVKNQQPKKKLVGYKDGKPVYDIGNGKWQVGE